MDIKSQLKLAISTALYNAIKTVEKGGGDKEAAVVTVSELVDLLGVNRVTVYRMIKRYKIPHTRKGRGPGNAININAIDMLNYLSPVTKSAQL